MKKSSCRCGSHLQRDMTPLEHFPTALQKVLGCTSEDLKVHTRWHKITIPGGWSFSFFFCWSFV